MFIKETEVYKKIKNNVESLLPLKIIVYLMTTVISFAAAYTMVCIQKMIDAVPADGNINLDIFYTTLCYAIVMVLTYIGLTHLNKYVSLILDIKSQRNTIKYLLKSFYKQNFSSIAQQESGDIASKLLKEACVVASWLAVGNLNFWKEMTNFVIKFVIIWNYLPLFAILVVLVMSFCFATTRSLNYKIAEYDKKLYSAIGSLNQFFIQVHKIFIDVKQLKKEDLYINKFLKLFDDSYTLYAKLTICWEILYETIFSLVLYLFPISVLIAGVYMTIHGDFTIGKTIAVYTLIDMAQDPLNAIASNLSECKKTMVLSERLEDFMVGNESEDAGINFLDDFNSLDFDCKSFCYDDKKELLENFSFNINKGEILCIKGQTGSGKSTIASLIMRFIKMRDGEIKINGINIDEYKSSSFYDKVNIFNQSPFIFQDTVKNNITFGEEYSKDLYDEVIEVVQLKDFISEYGDEHILNEEANNISCGQKQRIGIARFLIRKPQLLILDEPTSALDKNTAMNFSIALKDFAKKYGMTIIVISHNSEFDGCATQIIHLT